MNKITKLALKKLLSRKVLKQHKQQVPQPKNSVKTIFDQCFKNKQHTDLALKIKRFQTKIHFRSYHYPVQYLCESWPFRLLDLKLKRPILVPRYESQYMMDVLFEQIRQNYKAQNIQNLRFVEYGCGSGALGLSIYKQLGMVGTMIDIQVKSVSLTIKNAIKNKCDLSKLNILKGDMEHHLQLMDQSDIVISNPPYLSEAHYQKYLKHQVKHFESKISLVCDEDGLKYIRMLTNRWASRVKPGILMLEYDGRNFQGHDEWLNYHVVLDQYQKRRYILLIKRKY